MHSHYVFLEIAIADELPIAAFECAHEFLVNLVMSANVQLQSAICVVLLPTIRMIADIRLELTRREIEDIRCSLVDPFMLL